MIDNPLPDVSNIIYDVDSGTMRQWLKGLEIITDEPQTPEMIAIINSSFSAIMSQLGASTVEELEEIVETEAQMQRKANILIDDGK